MLTSMLRYSSGLAEAGPNDLQIIWHCAAGLGKDALVRGTLGGVLLRVFSHGEVRLRSSDPLDEPEVEFRLLSDDRDRRRLRECLQRLTDLVRHPTVASISDDVRVMRPDLSLVPMPTELEDAGEALDEWLDATVYDDAHPAGTCRMGTPGDPAAVVDTDCRVIGYDRLRVCDASVMPDLVKANPNLTIVAMAQRLLARMSESVVTRHAQGTRMSRPEQHLTRRRVEGGVSDRMLTNAYGDPRGSAASTDKAIRKPKR
jgi:choline dehydrogenase-like flavoprotein